MDFHKLISRYHQFGGIRLVFKLAKVGALWPTVKACVRCVVKRHSFKQIYPEVLKRIEPLLIKRYEPLMRCNKDEVTGKNLEHRHSKVIWFCWLQGIEKAPSIVKTCYNSLKLNLPDRIICVIDNENWKEFIELPDHIVKKWEKKQIPAALFSDLLRLELLVKYGGTWIDSTVLYTGVNGLKVDLLVEPAHYQQTENQFSSSLAQSQHSKFQEYLDADLFLFQYTEQGSIPVSISNWFITACSNNEILIVLRNMLYAYWKDYDCTLDYYIFHLFFSMLSKEYPEEIKAMPYGRSKNSLVLLHHWGEMYDQKKWYNLTSRVCFHKLAFRVDKKVMQNKGNYYNYILTEYGCI